MFEIVLMGMLVGFGVVYWFTRHQQKKVYQYATAIQETYDSAQEQKQRLTKRRDLLLCHRDLAEQLGLDVDKEVMFIDWQLETKSI